MTEPLLSIEERLLTIENTLFHLDFANEDELTGEQALARSVNGLSATAATLASVLDVVQKNQAQLVGLERTAEANVSAISKSSTKVELLGQVARLGKEREQDKSRVKWTIIGALLISLSLIGNNFVPFTVFKNDRRALAPPYSTLAATATRPRRGRVCRTCRSSKSPTSPRSSARLCIPPRHAGAHWSGEN